MSPTYTCRCGCVVKLDIRATFSCGCGADWLVDGSYLNFYQCAVRLDYNTDILIQSDCKKFSCDVLYGCSHSIMPSTQTLTLYECECGHNLLLDDVLFRKCSCGSSICIKQWSIENKSTLL